MVCFGSLLIGKTIGICGFAMLAQVLGFKLPGGMGLKETFIVGIIAGLGLTVALFVAGVAYTEGSIEGISTTQMMSIQGAAKMGALFSAVCGFLALILARMMGIKKID